MNQTLRGDRGRDTPFGPKETKAYLTNLLYRCVGGSWETKVALTSDADGLGVRTRGREVTSRSETDVQIPDVLAPSGRTVCRQV